MAAVLSFTDNAIIIGMKEAYSMISKARRIIQEALKPSSISISCNKHDSLFDITYAVFFDGFVYPACNVAYACRLAIWRIAPDTRWLFNVSPRFAQPIIVLREIPRSFHGLIGKCAAGRVEIDGTHDGTGGFDEVRGSKPFV